MSDTTLVSVLAKTPPTKAPLPKTGKKYKFQVLGGTHYEQGEVEDPTTGRKGIKDIAYGKGREAGDIVDSNLELDRLHNRRNSLKFRRLGEDGDPFPEELRQERLRASDAETRYRKALDRMSVRELVELAEDEKVEVKGQTKKEELVRTLLSVAGITTAG